jgi:hypothetical protein
MNLLVRHLVVAGVALSASASLAACVDTDNRPQTLAYITETILKPSCGTVNCHSAAGNTRGYQFDTVAGSKKSLQGWVAPGDAASSAILAVLRRTSKEPMPPSDVIADADIALIEAWINAGAPGL